MLQSLAVPRNPSLAAESQDRGWHGEEKKGLG